MSTKRALSARFRPLRALRRDQGGTTALEFAFIAAPFFGLLIAIIQTSMVFFAQQALESANQAAARQVLTGAAQKAGWSKASFTNYACTRLPSFLKCANLIVDVRKVNSYASADLALPTITYSNGKATANGQYNAGAPGDIVLVRLMYPWTVADGPLGFDLSNMSNNQRLLVSTSLARSEPY